MDKVKLKHLPEYRGLSDKSDPGLSIVEMAEVKFNDGAQYLLYVIGVREYHAEKWDIIHSIASKNDLGHKGLKFCPLEEIVSYTVLSKNPSSTS